MAIERCWELTRPATFDILRDRRLGLVACACVDTAIWDAVGKATRPAAVAALGRLPRTAPDDLHRRLLRQPVGDRRGGRGPRASAGFAGMKFKVGGLAPEDDAERFQRGARGRPARTSPAADANQGWTREQALRFARLVADYDLHWFEEPCRWHNDRRAMRDVRTMAACASAPGRASSPPAAAAT